MSQKETRIVMHDFTDLVQARQMALEFMNSGIQFAFCPEPISISHPMIVKVVEEDQPTTA